MRCDLTAWAVSLLLHMILLATAIACTGVALPYTKPVLIDFTSESVSEAYREVAASRSGGTPPTPVVRPAQQRTAKNVVVAAESSPQTMPTAALEQSAEAVPVVAAASETATTSSVAATHSGGSSGNGIAGSGNGVSAGGGDAASGRGGRGPSEETLRQRYLKKHFAYIRDRVASNLRYPGMAQRMGWSGNLAVEFVVGMDGSAETVRVVKSSGVPLLDSDARDTVLRSAPFPKPPVSARLVIPVAYHLEN